MTVSINILGGALMGIIGGIVLVVLGALALPSLIAAKAPNAKDLLDKIAPYQGWIGGIAGAWGVWGVINSVFTLSWLGTWPLWWATNLAGNVLSVLLGFIFGYSLISHYALSNAPEDVKAKAEEARKMLVGMQGTLGILGLIVGIWVILYNVLLYGILNI